MNTVDIDPSDIVYLDILAESTGNNNISSIDEGLSIMASDPRSIASDPHTFVLCGGVYYLNSNPDNITVDIALETKELLEQGRDIGFYDYETDRIIEALDHGIINKAKSEYEAPVVDAFPKDIHYFPDGIVFYEENDADIAILSNGKVVNIAPEEYHDSDFCCVETGQKILNPEKFDLCKRQVKSAIEHYNTLGDDLGVVNVDSKVGIDFVSEENDLKLLAESFKKAKNPEKSNINKLKM